MSILIPLQPAAFELQWEEKRAGEVGDEFGAGRAVPVTPFIYPWRFQCPITHAAAWEILLIETQLKPCVSNTDRLRGKQKERERGGEGNRQNRGEEKHLSCSEPHFFLYVHRCLLLKPPLAPMNNEKEQWMCLHWAISPFTAGTYTPVSKWVGTWADKAEKLEKMCQECLLMPQTDLGEKIRNRFWNCSRYPSFYWIHLCQGNHHLWTSYLFKVKWLEVENCWFFELFGKV